MKKLIATLGLALGLMALPALSQAQGTPQQSRMAQCNKEATGKTGEARKTFMKECLASKPAAAAETAKPASKEASKPERKTEQKAAAGEKKLTPQQEKMSFCSKDAKAKGMKGEERKKFMSECLRKK